jgi:hypothetical protein
VPQDRAAFSVMDTCPNFGPSLEQMLRGIRNMNSLVGGRYKLASVLVEETGCLL